MLTFQTNKFRLDPGTLNPMSEADSDSLQASARLTIQDSFTRNAHKIYTFKWVGENSNTGFKFSPKELQKLQSANISVGKKQNKKVNTLFSRYVTFSPFITKKCCADYVLKVRRLSGRTPLPPCQCGLRCVSDQTYYTDLKKFLISLKYLMCVSMILSKSE